MQNFKQGRLSFSALKAFAKSPAHYIEYLNRKPATEAMAFGSAVHAAILEPEKFAKEYHVAPECDRRTKAGKEIYQAFKDSIGNAISITALEMETINRIQARVHKTEAAMTILEDTQKEVKGEGVIGGVPFIGFADALTDRYAIDLKTCRDASPEAFMREAHQGMFHLQAAVYRRLFGINSFFWIALEKEAPYAIGVYQQSPRAEDYGDAQLDRLMARWHEWDGSYQGYAKGIMQLDIPRWA